MTRSPVTTSERSGTGGPLLPSATQLRRLAAARSVVNGTGVDSTLAAREWLIRTYLEHARGVRSEERLFAARTVMDLREPVVVVRVPGEGAGPKGNVLMEWTASDIPTSLAVFGETRQRPPSAFGLPSTSWTGTAWAPRPRTFPEAVYLRTTVAPLRDPFTGDVILGGGARQYLPTLAEHTIDTPAVALARLPLLARLTSARVSLERLASTKAWEPLEWLHEWLTEVGRRVLRRERGDDLSALMTSVAYCADRHLALLDRPLASAITTLAVQIALREEVFHGP